MRHLMLFLINISQKSLQFVILIYYSLDVFSLSQVFLNNTECLAVTGDRTQDYLLHAQAL